MPSESFTTTCAALRPPSSVAKLAADGCVAGRQVAGPADEQRALPRQHVDHRNGVGPEPGPDRVAHFTTDACRPVVRDRAAAGRLRRCLQDQGETERRGYHSMPPWGLSAMRKSAP